MHRVRRYTIDRIEAGWAVLIADDSDACRTVASADLPVDAREGCSVCEERDGWRVDEETTTVRRTRIRARLDRLCARGRSPR